jgi:hypothetical protein|tara:strand:- start:4443 stop:4682 length:240 start_codon:yes stop_codon:yes gene_type:complete
MYTVEIESDASVITTLDQKDMYEDVQLILGDDGVAYMRQFEPEMESYQMLMMSSQQWIDLIAAYNSTEGAYYVEVKDDR